MSTIKHMNIIFSLPPSVNACWRSVRGRTILSKEYRKWKADNLHGPRYGDKITMLQKPCDVTINIHRGYNWRKCDIDNRIKPVLDQLKHCGYIADDNSDYIRSVCVRLSLPAGDGMESYVSIDLVPSEENC